MVLTNQLIYLKNVKTMRKIFSNYVCFSKPANQESNSWCLQFSQKTNDSPLVFEQNSSWNYIVNLAVCTTCLLLANETQISPLQGGCYQRGSGGGGGGGGAIWTARRHCRAPMRLFCIWDLMTTFHCANMTTLQPKLSK